jgi:hypothetical protein
MSAQFGFDPVLPPTLLLMLMILGFVLAWLRPGTRSVRLLRCIIIGVIGLNLMGPYRDIRDITYLPRTVVVVVDRTDSATLPPRTTQIDNARNALKKSLSQIPNITPVFVDVTNQGVDQSNILPTIEQAFAGIPRDQRGGTILITDGVLHDLADIQANAEKFGPFHILQAGKKSDHDLRLRILDAPAYGLIGKEVQIHVIIEGDGPNLPTALALQIQDNQGIRSLSAQRGEKIAVTLPIRTAGNNVFSLGIPSQNDELTDKNNNVSLNIQGVRDRLKVLLVSGEPSIGGRMWRNILTSDPGIDLVHFTILRSPTSLDPTPSYQLALIPFPFEDLFSRKLPDFDLVILDRYRANLIMPNVYLDNIANYVRHGGALLDVSGKGDGIARYFTQFTG